MYDWDGAIGLILQIGLPLIFIIAYATRKVRRNKQRKHRDEVYRQHRVPKSSVTPKSRREIDLELIASEIGADKHELMDKKINGFEYQVPKHHLYSIFSKIKIIRVTQQSVKIFASLRQPLPSNLDIRLKREIAYGFQSPISIPRLSSVFNIHSGTPDLWEYVLKDEDVKAQLLALRTHLEYILLRGEYVEGMVYYESAVIGVLNFVGNVHAILMGTKAAKEDKIEALACYNCEDPFDPLEEECDKCGSTRPRCIVCFLDLKPSEKQDVVKLPCCEIYAHTNHIISWLQQNPNCPNCHENLSHWLSRLTMI